MYTETKYRIFIDNLKTELIDIIDGVFDANTDPEVIWHVFRTELKKVKKAHSIEFGKFMEADDENPIPESEIAIWRKNNQHLK